MTSDTITCPCCGQTIVVTVHTATDVQFPRPARDQKGKR